MSKYDLELWEERFEEFRTKKLISSEQKTSLMEMLKSKDGENKVVVMSIVKVFIKDALAATLNTQQKKAFEDIIEHFEESKHNAAVLKGYAGTGKTFLVKKLIEYVMQTEPDSRMAITAPTNKAVKVLYANSANNITGKSVFLFDDIFEGEARIVYATTHKILALKEIVTDDGKQLFEVDKFSKTSLSSYDYLFVDEVSMLDDKLTSVILSNKKVKVLFIGDPAQIPPVNRKDCIPFRAYSDYSFKYAQLTEIMRQKEQNPIIEHSFTIRQNLLKPKPIPVLKTELNDKDEGVQVLNPLTDKLLLREIMKKYVTSPQFKQNPDYFKVLAWRRASVTYVNNVIREQIYGSNPPRFVVGERLLAQKPIFERAIFKSKNARDKEYWKVSVNNSEELTVVDILESAISIKWGHHVKSFKAYELKVCYEDILSGDTKRTQIKIVHESEEAAYNKFIGELKEGAIKAKNSALWVMYFDSLKHSADVGYNYALTVHRSQGSTYEHALVLEDDLDANHKVEEKNRIKYTAYTRASKKLYVLRTNDLVKETYHDYRTEDYTSTGPT